MDWTERMGTKLYAMPRGIERQGMTPTNPMKWTSKYGSVVATCLGRSIRGRHE
jgi:penicillin V acylase-like amidase (Ntn superfamily)